MLGAPDRIARPPVYAYANAKARTYNGVDQYGVADAMASRLWTEAGSWTWIIALAAPLRAGWQRLVSIADSAGASSPYYIIAGGNSGLSAGDLVVGGHDGTTGTLRIVTAPPTPFNGAWHLVAVRDSPSALTIWIDGATQTLGAIPRKAGWVPTRASIGVFRYGPTPALLDSPLDGQMSHVARIGRVVSDSEMADLYTAFQAGTMDLRTAHGAYSPDPSVLTLDDWQGDGGDTPARGLNHGGEGGAIRFANMTAADIVAVGA